MWNIRNENFRFVKFEMPLNIYREVSSDRQFVQKCGIKAEILTWESLAYR